MYEYLVGRRPSAPMIDIAKIEAELTKDIEAFLAGGGKLICKSFRRDGGYCALSCGGDYKDTIDRLGILERWASFTDGFDGNQLRDEADVALYELGKRLREKYKPVDAYEPTAIT